MNCWFCSVLLELPDGPVSFKALCEACGSWLHVCKGCKYYQPGLSNDCKIPDTPCIRDRESANFCEEFRMKGYGSQQKKDPEEAIKELFGEETDSQEGKSSQDRFDDLFTD